MDVTVKIKGLAELEARLTEMDALAGQRILTRVLRKVAKPMADRARGNASSIGRSQALALSISIWNRKPKYGNIVANVAVGSRAKQKIAITRYNQFYSPSKARKGIFYGWMVDRGTVRSRSNRWWTPAVNAEEPKATLTFFRELQAAMRRIERRTSKTPSPDSVVPE